MGIFNQLDPWGLLVLVVSAIALFAVAKWAKGISDSSQFAPPIDPGLALPNHDVQWAPSPPQVPPPEPTFGPEPQLGPVRITKFYFSKFDLATGPQDPYSFYDELFVELYDSDSGSRWMQSYGVATPRGLEEILKDKQWNYLYANGIIVVPKYDVTPIREAVVARLAEDNELFKPEKRVQEESL